MRLSCLTFHERYLQLADRVSTEAIQGRRVKHEDPRVPARQHRWAKGKVVQVEDDTKRGIRKREAEERR